MRAGSVDLPPVNGKAVQQRIDALRCLLVGRGAQVSIVGGGQDGVVTEDFLDFEQVNAGFDQVGGITVAQTGWGNLFVIPPSATPWRKVVGTPPRSSGVVA